MRIITSTLQLAKEYPAAYNALPESYRSDDCLEYQVDDFGEIRCYPKPDQESALGYWSCIYNPRENYWL